MSTTPIASLTPQAATPAQAAPVRTGTAPAAPAQPPRPEGDGLAAQTAGKDLHAAVKKIEQLVQPAARDLRFSIDEDTGITVVKLIDTETQTVLRQIPTQEAMEISKALDKLQGLLVKDKA